MQSGLCEIPPAFANSNPLTAKLGEHPVADLGLLAAHALEIGVTVVVVTAKMQAAVDDVGQDLLRQGQVFNMPLLLGDFGTDNQFTMLEADHVGGSRVVEELGMHAAAFARADDDNIQLAQGWRPGFPQRANGQLSLPAQQTNRQTVFALPVEDPYLWRQVPCLSCVWTGIRGAHGACSSG